MSADLLRGSIAFRRLAQDDLADLFLWLCHPHVRRGYSEAPSSYAEVLARYGPRTGESNVVHAHVIVFEGAAAGYAQHYALDAFPDYAAKVAAAPRTAAMDLLIGEDALVGGGLGTRAIRRYLDEIVFADAAFDACIAAPAEGHAQAIRAFEKAGFRRWKEVVPGDGPPECVLRVYRG